MLFNFQGLWLEKTAFANSHHLLCTVHLHFSLMWLARSVDNQLNGTVFQQLHTCARNYVHHNEAINGGHATFFISLLTPCDDKRYAIRMSHWPCYHSRHRYRVVCALSIFLDLVPHDEGMNYLDTFFRLSRSPSFSLGPFLSSLSLSFSVNFIP